MDDSFLFPSYHQLTKICSNKNITSESNIQSNILFFFFLMFKKHFVKVRDNIKGIPAKREHYQNFWHGSLKVINNIIPIMLLECLIKVIWF